MRNRQRLSLITVVSAALNVSSATVTDSSWRKDLGVSPQTWSLAMKTSGRLALLDLHDLYVKEQSQLQSVRLPLFRGGGGGGGAGGSTSSEEDDDILSHPHLSLSTAWSAAAQLPAPSQSATKAAIEESVSSSQPSSPSNDLLAGGDGDSTGQQQEQTLISAGSRRPRQSTGVVATTTFDASAPARALVTLWASWNILNGSLLAFSPKDSYNYIAYLVEAIGIVRVSQGLQLLFAAGANMPPKKAMGVALLTRLVFLVVSFAKGSYDTLQTQSRSPFLVSASIMSTTAFCLLSDKGRPNLMANVFSLITLIKGVNMMIRPTFAATKFFAMDTSSIAADVASKIPGKCRSLGFHLVVSSVFMNALTLGVEPIQAAGYSAGTWFVLLAELTFVTGGYRSLSDVPRAYLFFLASALTCSVVFLSDKWRQNRLSSTRSIDKMSTDGWNKEEGSDMVWKHEDVPLKLDRRDS